MKALVKLVLALGIALSILILACAFADILLLQGSPTMQLYVNALHDLYGIGGTMGTLIVVAILLALCIPLVLIVGAMALGWAAIRRVGGRETRSSEADEARMIQDIYRGLMKMEERVEALETLLMDTQRKGTK